MAGGRALAAAPLPPRRGGARGSGRVFQDGVVYYVVVYYDLAWYSILNIML